MELTTNQSKNIIIELENASNFKDIEAILKKYSQYELKGSHLGRAFEKMFIQNMGFSPSVTMNELQKYHHSFYTTNGGDWCRSNQGYLGTKYNIKREIRNNRIFSVKADGFNKNTKINQSIRSDIYKYTKTKRCVILDISSNIEVDHKDGMKDDWRLNDKSMQKIEDFKPLSKTANDAKRQHCKKCLETGKRYNAKKLGYSESYTYGSENSKTCVGCYWYDPVAFNKEISKNFEKLDK